MTREEAIEILKSNYPDACFEQLRDAVDTAISALKQSDVPDINDGDMISRRAAIAEITEYGGSDIVYMSVGELKRRIKQLPSAQPEQRWIPWNSGKFPEESGTYTVTAYDGATKRVTYAKYQKRLKQWELTGARAYWRVLAWMPLPEPYKGKQE